MYGFAHPGWASVGSATLLTGFRLSYPCPVVASPGSPSPPDRTLLIADSFLPICTDTLHFYFRHSLTPAQRQQLLLEALVPISGKLAF